mmetsp:Transcript_29714/g.73631  ORF Transcript_29714/g.73631 Transcript_29714/m.73631 type:complete len:234 (-) Transcript_29714:381-1082(-)
MTIDSPVTVYDIIVCTSRSRARHSPAARRRGINSSLHCYNTCCFSVPTTVRPPLRYWAALGEEDILLWYLRAKSVMPFAPNNSSTFETISVSKACPPPPPPPPPCCSSLMAVSAASSKQHGTNSTAGEPSSPSPSPPPSSRAAGSAGPRALTRQHALMALSSSDPEEDGSAPTSSDNRVHALEVSTQALPPSLSLSLSPLSPPPPPCCSFASRSLSAAPPCEPRHVDHMRHPR